MGQTIKEIISTAPWMTILSLGCVMLLTLFRYETGWSDQLNLMGWCITLLGFVAIGCASREVQTVRWSLIDTLVVLCFLFVIANAAFLSHYPIAHQIIIGSECMMLYGFMRVINQEERITDKILVYVMAVAGVYESVTGILQLMGVTDTGLFRGQMTGSFLNPGPMGIYLAIMLSACTCYYLQTHDRMIGASILLMLAVLPASMSRTAMLAYGVVLLLLFKSLLIRHWKLVIILIVGGATAFYYFKQGSADSRTLMNIVSFREWQEHPWWGCGLGGYVQSLAHGQMEFFATHPDSRYVDCVGSTDMAFNEYMKVLVEQGVVGLLLMTGILGLTLYHLFRRQSPLAYAMIAISLAALFSYPFHLPQFMLLTTLLTALAAKNDMAEVKINLVMRGLIIGCLAVGIVFTYILRSEASRRTELYQEAQLFSSMHDEAFIDDYYELLPTMTDNRQFLFDFGKTLREAGRYNDSNAILRRGTLLDTDPMAYVVMGRNYEDMNLYEEADSLYRQAFLLQPNRIYPLYRQMKLYEKTGDKQRFIQKAREVKSFHPKIMSPAVNDMKEEARKIVEYKSTQDNLKYKQ